MRVKTLAHKSVRLECRLLKGPAHTLYMQPLREPLFQRSARGDTGLWQENEYPTVSFSLRSSVYIQAVTIVSCSSLPWITSVTSGKSSLFLKPNKELRHTRRGKTQAKKIYAWLKRQVFSISVIGRESLDTLQLSETELCLYLFTQFSS